MTVIGNGGRNRIGVYVHFRFRPTSWLSQWMSRRPTFRLVCHVRKQCNIYGSPLCAADDYYFRYRPPSWKCTITVVYPPRSHFQSPTFKSIISVKFTSVLRRCTMSVVAKRDISTWPPKPEIITYLELWQIASKFQRQILDFRWWQARYKISQMIATTIDDQKLQRLAIKINVYIAIYGRRWLSQSPRVSFFELGVVENPRFAVGVVIVSVIVPEIYVFPVLAATLPFPVVGHCDNHLAMLFGSPWSKIQYLPLEFRRYLL